MNTIILAHAVETGPESLWYPYLRAALDGRAEVRIPALPDPGAPDPEAWLTALTAAGRDTDPGDTVLVGHSLGGVTLLRLLERHDTDRHGPYAGAVLVATPYKEVGYEALNPFFAPRFDWARIRRAARAFQVLIAADDPVLTPDPFDHARHYVTELGATATVRAAGGHFPIWSPDDIPTGLVLPEVTPLVTGLLPAASS
ncbi:RBBP9/YdeN family alpha/beta hydrolase [Planobispora rosea]|uniref:RBBP9/YdeN family alpha/beta hydrolase n=1 Tax=Planobispora rosea TaxID=35762 RepID=UPI00083A2D89|nr:alpha/beta fold hydrolase [Planobispora rosea]